MKITMKCSSSNLCPWPGWGRKERRGRLFCLELGLLGLLYSSKESKFVRTKPRPEPTWWNESYWCLSLCWRQCLFFRRKIIPYSIRSIWMCPCTHGTSICWTGMVSTMICWTAPDPFWRACRWVLTLIHRTAAGGRAHIIIQVCRWDFHMTTQVPWGRSRELA